MGLDRESLKEDIVREGRERMALLVDTEAGQYLYKYSPSIIFKRLYPVRNIVHM